MGLHFEPLIENINDNAAKQFSDTISALVNIQVDSILLATYRKAHSIFATGDTVIKWAKLSQIFSDVRSWRFINALFYPYSFSVS